MIIEIEMLHAKVAQVPGFPEELKTLLEHLIISHHGQYEFGSPKLPMFPEALMLHYLDDLDSKMESMRAHFEREADLESPWTSYNPSLGRPLLNRGKFLENKAPAVTAQAQSPDSATVTPSAAVAASASASVPVPMTTNSEADGISQNQTPTLPGLDRPDDKDDKKEQVVTAARGVKF